MSKHLPVMPSEVIAALQVKAGDLIVDGTVGLGGHATLILEASAQAGRLIAFDRDGRNLEEAKAQLAKYGDRARFFNEPYSGAARIFEQEGFGLANGVLIDLGFSSVHVDEADRGFSFMHDGPLDMRYDQRQELTAEMIVNGWSKAELADLFRIYGEDRNANRIADLIFKERKSKRITTTGQLAELIERGIGRHGKIHPATQTFQALRLAVNDELNEVKQGLKSLLEILAPGGRLAVITFHSLEDRIVKNFFKEESDQLEIVTKKPIIPTETEIKLNPRSRSAKLRIAKKKLL